MKEKYNLNPLYHFKDDDKLKTYSKNIDKLVNILEDAGAIGIANITKEVYLRKQFTSVSKRQYKKIIDLAKKIPLDYEEAETGIKITIDEHDDIHKVYYYWTLIQEAPK